MQQFKVTNFMKMGIVLTMCFSVFVAKPVNAEESLVTPTIIPREELMVNGRKLVLYDEYEDNDIIVDHIKQNFKVTLTEIENTYGMASISHDNILEYKDIILEKIVSNSNDEKYSELYKIISTYEHKSLNNQIRDILSEYNETNDNSLLYEIDLYSSHFSDRFKPKAQTRKNGLNIANANIYALSYATFRNPDYKSYRNDCANFVSQALAYGGMSVINDTWYPYTVAWINAHALMNNWGTPTRYGNFQMFAQNATTGSVIGVDFYGDGIYDHVGYIVAEDNYEAWYNEKYYCDFKVAQHSDDYCAWVSSTTNGWENDTNSTYWAIW